MEQRRLLVRGVSGPDVTDVQNRLRSLGHAVPASELGRYEAGTEEAVRLFQEQRGIDVDGKVGPDTWRELVEAGFRLGARTLYLRHPVTRGDDVRDLQFRLNALGFDCGKEDGVFGPRTSEAVKEFQRGSGLTRDGAVSRRTVDALDRMARRITPTSKSALIEKLRKGEGGLAGRIVFLDPGHGGEDIGTITRTGIPESYLTWRVAEVIEERLRYWGAQPTLSRAIASNPDAERRATDANEAEAAVAVSVHVGCRPSSGPSIAFWSTDRSSSSLGSELAGSISAALGTALGRSSTVEGKNLPFLRRTRMPAVVIDLAGAELSPLATEDAWLTHLGQRVGDGIRDYFEN